MAKISLRAYQREIENLIERGQTDEAIAHCKYILRYYPKHIETYRLLGKAYIESQRYTEASDILQRVLSVIPDDLVAQIGMSIIREDEGNLDASIYHMERAFEIQPSNVAVQEELKRIYGRRDGVEPSKIRLTRGALVRMYARGELHQQAIGEIRAALAEEPNRIDLEVILAKMAVLSGKKVEAVEICGRVLAKLPYCAEANRLLAEILPETSRAEDAKIYQQRLIDLDPYLGYISPTTPTTNDVPENAVALERLDWQPGETQPDTRPQWAQAVGASWDTREEEAPAADWLSAAMPPAEQPSSAAQPSTPDTGIPDFLQAAGWSVSDGDATSRPETQVSGLEQGEDLGAGELAAAEMPDWLQSIAPPQTGAPAGTSALETEEDSGRWLDQMMAAQPPAESAESIAPIDAAAVPPVDLSAMDMPDWLSGLTGEAPVGNTPSPEPVAGEEPTSRAEAVPDWLSGLTGETPATEMPEVEAELPIIEAEIAAEPAEALPDWLSGLTGETPATEVPEIEAELPTIEAEIPAEPAEALPDWLSGLTGETPATEMPEVEAELPTIEAEIAAEPAEALPDWLSGLTGETPAAEMPEVAAELPAVEAETPAEPAEALPDWLSGLTGETPIIETPEIKAETEMPVIEPEAPAEQAESLPDWLSVPADELPAEAEPTAPQTEATPEWIPETALPEEELVRSETTETPATDQALPDWLAGIGEPVEEQPEPKTAEPVAAAPTEDEGFAWLEALAARQGAEANELLVAAEDRRETPPEWATEAETTETVLPPVEEPAEPVAEAAAELIETPVEEIVETTEAISEIQTEAAPITEKATTAASEDEAFAWLEALAARQGAEADELLVAAEDRRETPPDWALETEKQTEGMEISEPESVAVEPVTETAVDLMAEAIEPEAEISIEPADKLPVETASTSAEDEAFAWLEALAARQGAEAEELLVAEADRRETPPDWALQAEEPVGAADSLEEPEPATVEDTRPTRIKPEAEVPPAEIVPEVTMPAAEAQAEVIEEQPVVSEVPTEPVAAEAPIPSEDEAFAWLEALAARQGAEAEELLVAEANRRETPPEWVQEAEQEAEASAPEALVEMPGEEIIEPVQQIEEAPESLVGIEPSEEMVAEAPEQPVAEMPAWIAAAVAEEASQPESPQLEPEAAELEPATTEEAIPDWLQGLAPAEEKPQESVLEWLGREEGGQPMTPPRFTEPQVVDQKEAPVEEEPVSLPAEEIKDAAEVHRQAQEALWKGDLKTAMALYNRLIENGLMLEEIIHDLRDALYRYPVDVEVWQTLGDAYARSNLLQEALETYTKAEELIR